MRTHITALAGFLPQSLGKKTKNKFSQVFSQAQLKLTQNLFPEWLREPKVAPELTCVKKDQQTGESSGTSEERTKKLEVLLAFGKQLK